MCSNPTVINISFLVLIKLTLLKRDWVIRFFKSYLTSLSFENERSLHELKIISDKKCFVAISISEYIVSVGCVMRIIHVCIGWVPIPVPNTQFQSSYPTTVLYLHLHFVIFLMNLSFSISSFWFFFIFIDRWSDMTYLSDILNSIPPHEYLYCKLLIFSRMLF